MQGGTVITNELSAVAGGAIYAHRFVETGTSTETSVAVTAADGTGYLRGITTAVFPSAANAAYNDPAAATDTVRYATAGNRVYLQVNGNSVNIAAGDLLKSTSAGVGVKAATDGDYYGAIALQPATTDGAVILVEVVSPGRLSVPA